MLQVIFFSVLTTRELRATQINSVTPLLWRHTHPWSLAHMLTSLISCRMISHPDCLLLFPLSFACITSSLNFSRSVNEKHQLCSSISNQTKTNSPTRTFPVSPVHTKQKASPLSFHSLVVVTGFMHIHAVPCGWLCLFIALPKLSSPSVSLRVMQQALTPEWMLARYVSANHSCVETLTLFEVPTLRFSRFSCQMQVLTTSCLWSG